MRTRTTVRAAAPAMPRSARSPRWSRALRGRAKSVSACVLTFLESFRGGRAPASRWEVAIPAPLLRLGDRGDLRLVRRDDCGRQRREPEVGAERLAVADRVRQERLQRGR